MLINYDHGRGYVGVYELVSGTWTLLGDIIPGEEQVDYFGGE